MKALQKFYGEDENARFKSAEQGKALQSIVNCDSDVLAVLPTGGGKTLLFFLPTLMEAGMTMVVIVPLIAVMQDLRNRCVGAGITCANWDPDNRLTVATNLLFVAVENAVESAFCNHLQILYSTGLLKRIVMLMLH
jgi:superfamily II DNA helicase RecQ